MIKNYFYDGIVSERIKEILEENLTGDLNFKSIVFGDYSALPVGLDDEFDDFFPAVLIYPSSNHKYDQNPVMNAIVHNVAFNIDYVYPDTGEDVDILRTCVNNTQKISSILVHKRTLDDFCVDKSDTEVGCRVMGSEISRIQYDSEVGKVFRDLQVPLAVSSITYNVQIQGYAEVY